MRGILELVFANNDYRLDRRCLVGLSEPYSPSVDSARVTVRLSWGLPQHTLWELKTLFLIGLWVAEVGSDDSTPAVAELSEFRQKLIDSDEDSLLRRPYRFWSDATNGFETKSVGEIVDERAEAVKDQCSALFVAIGGAHVIFRQLH